MMKNSPIIISFLVFWSVQTAAGQNNIVLENAHIRYTISPLGKNLSFLDLTTGTDYLQNTPPSYCALLRSQAVEHPADSVSYAHGLLTLQFTKASVTVVLRAESLNSYIRLTVASVNGPQIDSLAFLNIPLTLNARPEEPFGACALSLNLITHVAQLPALQTELKASCYRKFGLKGAQVALVGMPQGKMLPALKQVLTNADQMPPCPVAGPWAQEIPFNHGSYIFNFGTLTEDTVDDWIATAKRLGVTQINNHGGPAFFRFGDFELDRTKWPQGWQTYRHIVKRLHDAGIDSIFHTYSCFIDKHSRYVTPIPDKRLDAFSSFTLAQPLTADATEILVNEPTKDISTITGFFVQNSVTLHIDDELVTFSAATKQPPWRFTGLTRGALGTKPAPHLAGVKARHLKERFGLFVPSTESSLFNEIAQNHADIVNFCDFDGIYLDAIDGFNILNGRDENWYWSGKFVFEIQKHLKKPVGMEMSSMWNHFWQYRTRWQAWDCPQRGHKRFIDLHVKTVNSGLLLPLHLGWWDFKKYNPPQTEPTYPDVIEYLGAKLIGWDAGVSLVSAIDQDRLRAVPLFQRVVDILRTCEELRRSGYFNDSIRAKLRQPEKDFSLFRDPAGKWRFRPTSYDPHTILLSESPSLSWNSTNPFETQPVKLRLEALMSAGSYDDPCNIILADLSDPQTFAQSPKTAKGVTATLTPLPNSDAHASAGVLTAKNSGLVPQNAAWVRLDRKFDPPLNLKKHQALSLPIEGDGLGEILAVRLESPFHAVHGSVADRYFNIDFTGSRLLTGVETESTRWSDYVWNDGKHYYCLYHINIDFGQVDSLSIWYNNLPPNKQVTCRLGPVKALPMIPSTVVNPTLTLNGQTISFPVEIPSGGFLEFNDLDDCTLYDSDGKILAQVTPTGTQPVLQKGDNKLSFSCDPTSGAAPRAKVTVISYDDPL